MMKYRNGYTLIEVVMVFVIIIISCLIIGPKLTGLLGGMGLETEAKRLRVKIREVKQLAITKHSIYRIQFDIDTETYDIKYDSGGGSYSLLETIALNNDVGIHSTSFVTPADKGAIAVFASTGATYSQRQLRLGQGLYKAIFSDDDYVLGSAVTQAKVYMYNQLGEDGRLINKTFTLFGDPALRLKGYDAAQLRIADRLAAEQAAAEAAAPTPCR